MTGAAARPWREVWQESLYGPGGFYRRPEGPAGHFTTSVHGPLGAVFAEVVLALAQREGCDLVVDVGAGRGELLAQLAAAQPALRLLGVDVVPRPADLPEPVRWLVSHGGAALPEDLAGLDGALVVAHEWLDVVPCTIAEVDHDGTLREVLVAPDGHESLGARVADADAAWTERWWRVRAPGDRVEIGLSRDDAWTDLVSRVQRGTLVAIDYAQDMGGSVRETFTAYRAGVQGPPVPGGSSDLTAHVAMDSLMHDELVRQCDAIRALGFSARTPEHALSRTDPTAYLRALTKASAVTALTDPEGLGGFVWAVVRVGGN